MRLVTGAMSASATFPSSSGAKAGGHRKGGRIALKLGDDIKVGGEGSPYVFRFGTVPEG